MESLLTSLKDYKRFKTFLPVEWGLYKVYGEWYILSRSSKKVSCTTINHEVWTDRVSLKDKKYLSFWKRFFLLQGQDYRNIVFGWLVHINYKLKAELSQEARKTLSIRLQTSQEVVLRKIARSQLHLVYSKPGFGKMEIYTQHILRLLRSQGGQFLIMLPEIHIAEIIHAKVQDRLDCPVVLWTSKTTNKRKRDIVHHIIENKNVCVVGSRSAVFLPFTNLRYVVVDEAHEELYNQEHTPIYSLFKNLRIWRVFHSNVGLYTASPSIEQWHDCNKYNINIVSVRCRQPLRIQLYPQQNIGLLNSQMSQEIIDKYVKNEGVIVYINHRGVSNQVLDGFNKRVWCPKCQHGLFFHWPDIYKCHKCSFRVSNQDWKPNMYGLGIENIAIQIIKLGVSEKDIVKLSSDNTHFENQNHIQKVSTLKRFVILATQIFIKGFHFPNIKHVFYIDTSNKQVKAVSHLYQLAGRAIKNQSVWNVHLQSRNVNKDCFRMLSKSYCEFIHWALCNIGSISHQILAVRPFRPLLYGKLECKRKSYWYYRIAISKRLKPKEIVAPHQIEIDLKNHLKIVV